jgi:alpha-galactosidase
VKIASHNRISSLHSLLGYGPALRSLVCAAFLVLVAVPHALAVDNGLARTPAMGWNSWNYYGCGINEAIVKQIAETIATNGMKEAGYEYVNLDDCWMATSRTSSGALVPDPTNFPDGMAAVAAYVHGRV